MPSVVDDAIGTGGDVGESTDKVSCVLKFCSEMCLIRRCNNVG